MAEGIPILKFAGRAFKLPAFGLALFLANGLSRSQALAEASVSVEISQIGDASHLEFSGLNEWKYDIKKDTEAKAERVIARVPELRLDAITRLKTYNDALIASVDVSEPGVDSSRTLDFSYLRKTGIDFF